MKRLLILNPNTSGAVTARLLAAAARLLPPGVEAVPATASFGFPVIATRASYAVAAHAALDCWAAAKGPFEAVVLGCFGDPGLEALRELSAAPVFGLAESAIRAAERLPGRFAIVTVGAAWGPMLEERVQIAGAGQACVGVFTIPGTGLDALTTPDAVLRRLTAAVAAASDAGARTVILGGATLTSLPRPAVTGVTFLDGFEAALAAACAASGAAALPLPQPGPPQGLGPALTRRLDRSDG